MKKHFNIIEEFVNKTDWRVKENANISYSISSLILHLSGYCIADYLLEKVYGDLAISDMHKRGEVHIHDLNLGLTVYCSGWSTIALLEKGIRNIPGTVTSASAKHFRTAINHIVNFVGCISNEAAGAQALNSIDTYLAGLIYKDYQEYLNYTNGNRELTDKLIRRDVKQGIQELMFHLNFPTRWGNQPPFTNVTLDLIVPPDLRDLPVWVGDKYDSSITYKDIQHFVDMFNYYFFTILTEGDAEGKGFTFPVVTVNYVDGLFERLNPDVKDIMLKSIAKFGSCYIQNCANGVIGGDKRIKPESARAMCCRLHLDLRELQNKVGGVFGAGDYTGSIGVVTVSLPYIAYCTKDVKSFFERLRFVMEEAQKSLIRKREVCVNNLELGLLPFFKEYLPTKFKTHFNTIGYVGLHEALLNLGIEDGILSKKGYQLAKDILTFMRDYIHDMQERDKVLCNLEATPAEGASYRLARLAKQQFPDIITSGPDHSPYFTNSCHPPAQHQGDIAFLINHQEELQCQHTGGTVVHFYIDGELPVESAETLIRTICQTKIPYFTLTTVYSWCPVHGYIPGRWQFCPYPHTQEDLEKYGVRVNDAIVQVR